jgi:hypothetical protein
MIALKRLAPVFGLVAVAGLAACSKDTNSPDNVDAAVMQAKLDALSAEFTGNAVFQSLATLSGHFTLTAAGQAAVRATLPLGVPRAPSTNLAAAGGTRLQAMRLYASLAPNSPMVLFPANVLGKTFVWDVTLDKYVQSTQTGAPANGVRFLLYTVDQATGMPIEPLQALGNVDLTDESTPAADILGVLVKFGSTTVADYTISAVVTTTSLSLTASGSLFGQTNRVDFTLENTVTQTSAIIDYHVQASNGYAVDIKITGTETSFTVDFTISGGGNSLQMVGSVTISGSSGTISIQIKYNGTVVATISGDVNNPTVTGAGGRQITQQEIAHLLAIFEQAAEVINTLGEVFGPGYLLF